MPHPAIRFRVPGKLMIAGEYAVLEPGQSAIVSAVNKYITVILTPSEHNRINLPNLGLHDIMWRYEDGLLRFSEDNPRLHYVASAISVVHEYLGPQAASTRPFCLTVESELDDPTGRKYGLGSSASVVVGIIAGLLQQMCQTETTITPDILFRLASAAHFRVQGSGSGADVAASVYGGFIRYTSFRPDWLKLRLAEGIPLRRLIEEKWPFVSVERLPSLPSLYFCVGWTGQPASTGPLIEAVQKLRQTSSEAYQLFLDNSEASVEWFCKGVKARDIDLILAAVGRNRSALALLGEEAGIPIETPELANLAAIAVQLGGAGKPSGAGGGDCGIAFVHTAATAQEMFKGWHRAGIEPLPIQVSQTGVAQLSEEGTPIS